MSHNTTEVNRQLRKSGYRVTHQRQLILDAVCDLGEHVSPEAVYEHVHRSAPTLSRATVYRVLHFLTEQRILAMVQLVDGRFGYEIAGPEPHHHLICRSCDSFHELPHSVLQAFRQAMEAQYNFEIDVGHVSFFGHCTDCRDAAGA
jgi:Fur family ferric uptake transcriptional regulator